jgi:phage terminase large subunit GpA-like protein
VSATVVLDGLRTLRRLIREAAIKAFQPPPEITISQWADDNRLLPQTSAEPGPFRTDRLPYMRRIQDVLGDDTTKEVVFAKSSQVGGSTCGEHLIGFTIDQDPSGIISVWPTEKKLQKWSLTRLDPLLHDTPCLARRFPRTGRRDAGDSMSTKIFPGGFLIAITAKSASDLKSDSARRAIAEELDEWEVDLKNQGDPLELLRVRQRTFWNRKLLIVSTPTTAEASRIWDELTNSSWEEYWVPCPHCGEFQVLRWRDGDESPDEAAPIASCGTRMQTASWSPAPRAMSANTVHAPSKSTTRWPCSPPGSGAHAFRLAAQLGFTSTRSTRPSAPGMTSWMRSSATAARKRR